MTTPVVDSDQARSVAVTVSGSRWLSESALAKPSIAEASAAEEPSINPSLSVPGTAGSDIRATTSVSAAASGSGWAGTVAAVTLLPGVAAGGPWVVQPQSPSAATMVAALRIARETGRSVP